MVCSVGLLENHHRSMNQSYCCLFSNWLLQPLFLVIPFFPTLVYSRLSWIETNFSPYFAKVLMRSGVSLLLDIGFIDTSLSLESAVVVLIFFPF